MPLAFRMSNSSISLQLAPHGFLTRKSSYHPPIRLIKILFGQHIADSTNHLHKHKQIRNTKDRRAQYLQFQEQVLFQEQSRKEDNERKG